MYFEQLSNKARQRDVSVLLIGAGEYGYSFVVQASKTVGLKVRAVCDPHVQNGVSAFQKSGYAADDIIICASRDDALTALEQGKVIVSDDALMLIDLPVDMVVEATGLAEPAAIHAEAALASGKHVAMVTKEADSIVGPLFSVRARAAGLVYTPVDGDQPSLLMQLVAWARLIGLDVICAGKSSEYDFIYDAERQTITNRGREVKVDGFDAVWDRGSAPVQHLTEARVAALSMFQQRTVPDMVELCLVANACDLAPDCPFFHAPFARTIEIADIFALQEDDGLLRSAGAIDVVNLLRRSDEASLAGGVFVIVRCEDAKSWEVLRAKGHIVSRSGKTAMIYRPSHLLGVESATTMLRATLEGQSSGPSDVRPRFDVVGITQKTLQAGTRLAALGHHREIDGIAPMTVPARAHRSGNPTPYYLLSGCELNVTAKSGTIITKEMLTFQAGSKLLALRNEMDAHFALS